MKKDNKGYTFNLTIILMLIVTIICVSVLAIVMANWNMKRTESKISSNTYTAESAIDDIRAGIQKQCSSEMKVVYTTLTSSMNTIPYNKLDDEFAKEYHARLTEKFGTDLKKTLNSYITAGVGYELTTEPTFEIKSDRKAFLRNIGVSYKTSDGEYTTKLYTDIEIDTPKMFEGMKNQVVDSTAYTDFVIISDGDLDLGGWESNSAGNAFPVNILGNVYSGGDTLLTMAHIKSDKFLVRGDLRLGLKDRESTIESETSGKNTQLYANNIILSIYNNSVGWNAEYFPEKTKYSLQANADFYISHDLIATGKNQSIKLSGNYYGFENDSSIAVNSKHCNLDLTGLDTLWLAGVNHLDYTQEHMHNDNYIKYPNTTVFEGNTSDLMGDSLSFNGLQVAYLVPSVCIYDKNGNQLSNPITKEQYDAGITVDLDKNKQSGGIDLGYYAKGYKPVFISYLTETTGIGESYKDRQRCYLYLTFQSTSKASEYLNLFCKTNKLFLRDEVNYFGLGDIKISNDTLLRTKGNVVTYENGAVAILNNTTEQLSAYLDTSVDYYRFKRNSMLSTLEENSSSELLDSVFNYIVDKDKLVSHETDTHMLSYYEHYYPGFESKFNTDAARCHVGNGWVIGGGGGIIYYSKDKSTGYETIIADAQRLWIKENFKGLVINTGEVRFTNGANEFTGLILCGDSSDIYTPDWKVSFATYHPMTFKSNDNGVYPVQYLLYEAPDHEKIQQYFRVLQGGSTDIVPNIHVEDYIKVRNRVTR